MDYNGARSFFQEEGLGRTVEQRLSNRNRHAIALSNPKDFSCFRAVGRGLSAMVRVFVPPGGYK